MKNILKSCLALLFILGCSSSDPTLTDMSITDDTVVTGQRVLAYVYSITDSPPLSYEWSATGGTIEEVEDVSYTAYWTAPEVPGTYAITCTVSDDEKNRSSHTFTVEVNARELERDLVGEGSEVITLTKQSDSEIGGIWASVRDDYLRFISSQSNEESVWSENFYFMLARTDSYTGLYTIWGVVSEGRDLIQLTSSAEATLTCESCLGTDTIHTLAKDVLDDTILWVGADSNLCYYDQTNDFWDNYLFTKTYDLSEGPDYVYAATNYGIYKLDGTLEPIYSGDTRAVLAVENGSATDVWSVTEGKIGKNGQHFALQPPTVAVSLDQDIAGNIWCGKYWWDGSQWNLVPGLESVTIVTSVASTEGLIYLLSDSGVLYRW